MGYYPNKRAVRKPMHSGADRVLRNYRGYSVGSTLVSEDTTTPLRTNRHIDRRLAAGGPWRGRIRRGKMVRRSLTPSGPGRVIGELNFLFNPTSVSFDYQIDPTQVPEDQKDYQNVPVIGQQASCSFQLMFDRTYEVMTYRDDPGVLEDVAVLEHLMGAILDKKTGVWAAPQGQSISVYFGGSNSMSFKGFFTSASVEMTHFTPEMVPVRLVMSISMRRTMEAEGNAATLSAATSTADQVLLAGAANYNPPPSRPTSQPSGSSSRSLPSFGGRNFAI